MIKWRVIILASNEKEPSILAKCPVLLLSDALTLLFFSISHQKAAKANGLSGQKLSMSLSLAFTAFYFNTP